MNKRMLCRIVATVAITTVAVASILCIIFNPFNIQVVFPEFDLKIVLNILPGIGFAIVTCLWIGTMIGLWEECDGIPLLILNTVGSVVISALLLCWILPTVPYPNNIIVTVCGVVILIAGIGLSIYRGVSKRICRRVFGD